MQGYDAWLEAPFQKMCAEGERFSTVADAFEESEDYVPALVEWVVEQLTAALTNENATVPSWMDEVRDRFRDSQAYEAIVNGRMAADDEMYDGDDEPDWDPHDPLDIEYDR